MEIGVRLREAREQRELTLSAVSNATKIPVRMLQAIENDDVAALPQAFFARAYLRAYAIQVGVDPADILAAFSTQYPSAPSAPLELHEAEVLAIQEEKRASHGWLVVVVGIAAAYGFYGFAPGTAVQPSAMYAAPAAALSETGHVPIPVSALMPGRAAGLQLQIQSRGDCIVSATADGESIMSRMVPAGENATIQGRGEIVLRVSDAGGCEYSISTAAGHQPDRAGETVIRVTQENQGTLLASAANSRPAIPASSPAVSESVPDAVGTSGVMENVTELGPRPIDASISDLLPSAPLPVAALLSVEATVSDGR